jgi:hypothetical protein
MDTGTSECTNKHNKQARAEQAQGTIHLNFRRWRIRYNYSTMSITIPCIISKLLLIMKALQLIKIVGDM